MQPWTLLAAVLLVPAVAGCIGGITPPYIVDPAREAAEPGRYRGDSYDRLAMTTLRGEGAQFPALDAGPGNDDAVVKETLRVAPPLWTGSRSPREVEADHARVMILRRRPRAAYVELTRLMRSASDPNLRAGAASEFASLDGRNRGGSTGVTPAYVGPEREVALSAVESLLLSDPSHLPRQAASYAWMWELKSATRPDTQALRALLARETDSTVRGNVERILEARGTGPTSPAAPRGDESPR